MSWNTTTLRRSAGPLLVAAALVAGGGWMRAQTTSAPTPDDQTQTHTMPMGSMMMHGQMGTMMAQHQQMMNDFTAMNQRLDALVKTMNAAKGTARVDAMAAVLNELVTQRMQMRERMLKMQGQMMQYMGGMQGGTMGTTGPGSMMTPDANGANQP